MANNFKNSKARNTGTAAVTLLTAPAGTNQYTLIGGTLCNKTSNVVKGSLYITDAGGDTYICYNVEIPVGATLVAIGGDQKITLMPGDVVKVVSDTAASIDTLLSYLEIV